MSAVNPCSPVWLKLFGKYPGVLIHCYVLIHFIQTNVNHFTFLRWDREYSEQQLNIRGWQGDPTQSMLQSRKGSEMKLTAKKLLISVWQTALNRLASLGRWAICLRLWLAVFLALFKHFSFSESGANSSETYSSTTFHPFALLSAILISFWHLQIQSFPCSTSFSAILFRVDFCFYLVKNGIKHCVMLELLLTSFEFHTSDLFIRLWFDIKLFFFLFQVVFEHCEDVPCDWGIISVVSRLFRGVGRCFVFGVSHPLRSVPFRGNHSGAGSRTLRTTSEQCKP